MTAPLPDAPPDLLTTDEASALLRLHKMTTYKLARCGHIPSVKIGGQWRFSRTKLVEWIETQSKKRMVGVR